MRLALRVPGYDHQSAQWSWATANYTAVATQSPIPPGYLISQDQTNAQNAISQQFQSSQQAQSIIPQGQVNTQGRATISVPVPVIASFACNAGCQATFRRDSDRIRHESSVHGINAVLHFCHVQGCPKSNGAGYKRKDKLTEHLWKKHANLGFVKRV
ncbi:hypothetical protein BDZ45DRAFT_698829 [Acephala macrosclerotiorum]|nr:hypothetical protein BDZ45DRAFT_698829 [Acephala macrosclerotiorum]